MRRVVVVEKKVSEVTGGVVQVSIGSAWRMRNVNQ